MVGFDGRPKTIQSASFPPFFHSDVRDSSLPKSLTVIDRAGVFVTRADSGHAAELLRGGGAVLRYRGQRVVALQLVAPDQREYGGGQTKPTRYSHDRETFDNPHGCWTLRRIPSSCGGVFTVVLDECLKVAA